MRMHRCPPCVACTTAQPHPTHSRDTNIHTKNIHTHRHAYTCVRARANTRGTHACARAQAVRDGFALALCDLAVCVHHGTLDEAMRDERRAGKRALLAKLRACARGEVLQRALVQVRVCVCAAQGRARGEGACLAVLCTCFHLSTPVCCVAPAHAACLARPSSATLTPTSLPRHL